MTKYLLPSCALLATVFCLQAATLMPNTGVDRFQCIYFATPEEIRAAPSITAVEGKEFAQPNDLIHITDTPAINVGDVYVIFYQGDTILDPARQKVIGYQTVALGQAQVVETDPDITLKVTQTYGKIRAGNRLLAKVANAPTP